MLSQKQYQQQLEKFVCQICIEELSIDNFTTLNCNHRFCTDCLKQDCIQQYEKNKRITLNEFKCPLCPKESNQFQFEPPTLENMLSEKQYNQVMLNTVITTTNTECPGCGIPFLNDQKNLAAIYCPVCQEKICNKCQKKFNANHICDKSTALKNLQIFDSQDDKYTWCPKCFTPYQKDEECDKVTCQQVCKSIFCFSCCSFYEIIINHDNEYHREGCKHYFPNPEKIKRLQKCCKNNKLCERPKSLAEFKKEVRNYLVQQIQNLEPNNKAYQEHLNYAQQHQADNEKFGLVKNFNVTSQFQNLTLKDTKTSFSIKPSPPAAKNEELDLGQRSLFSEKF